MTAPCLQLYYNYYLRTSGLNFLLESHVFYDAIHGVSLLQCCESACMHFRVEGLHKFLRCHSSLALRAWRQTNEYRHSKDFSGACTPIPSVWRCTSLWGSSKLLGRPAERGYFASEEEDEDLLVKQLRFYTRFVTVCLLLGKRDEVWDHLEKLKELVEEFKKEAQVRLSTMRSRA